MGNVVRIFHPADPLGVIPGGIDTFIRGILNWASPDLQFELVGVTTNPVDRPVGQWTECQLDRRSFRFFPVLALEDAARRTRIPLTLSYTLAVMRYRKVLAQGFDMMDFHRIEPLLPWLFDGRPKHLFQHQHMEVLHNSKADIRWKYAPALFSALERVIIPRFSNIWCVHNGAVDEYRRRFPEMKDRVQFCPTWMDPEIFFPAKEEGSREELRRKMASEFGLTMDRKWLIFVGRLDSQKNPALLVEGFARLEDTNAELVLVGGGVLAPEIEALVAARGLQGRVHLPGILPQRRIADLLRSADLFVLSSAYEGMPMCVLEALGCGLPVVTTAVGEVRRVVRPGLNGEIAATQDVVAYAEAMARAIAASDAYRGQPCLDAVAPFTPAQVLSNVFSRYQPNPCSGAAVS